MTDSLLQDVGNGFKKRKSEISREIIQVFSGEHERSFNLLAEETLKTEFEKLIDIISDQMMNQTAGGFGNDVFRWGKSFGRVAIQSGVSVDEGLLMVPFFRRTLVHRIRAVFLENDYKMEDYFVMADFLHPLIDQTVYAFTQAYVEHHNDSFQHAKDELMKLSVPLVPLTEEVAILPLIGTVDTQRSQELLTKALNKGREMELSYIIIDLSGVHMIDTAVAQNLFQLHDALQITGITGVFSGLRPELAQTMVSLGISFDQMHVCGTLPRALKLTGVSIS